ncbi:hypothetical protein NE235_10900 [Actinoallomurus spadix]|uniref:Uncharacterized protein n=1 Tax=Actinoallomurus spadix TaxID=79912 RepID=A0ABN0WVZ1_9ACTN|nr:hypothetical protein [Actinoallomurus spadix]MCO5986610.1 hypothetical protein [Actinoallomurus spadix]
MDARRWAMSRREAPEPAGYPQEVEDLGGQEADPVVAEPETVRETRPGPYGRR